MLGSDARKVLYAFYYKSILDYNKFPINTTFVAYLLENANLGLSRGVAFAHFFKAPSRGFCMKKKKKKRTIARQMPGGRPRLELTEPLDFDTNIWL